MILYMPESNKDTSLNFSMENLFDIQDKFSRLFFDKDSLTIEQKEEMTKSFTLALHAEVSSIVKEINFKDHVSTKKDVAEKSILFEGVDAFRYILAILNLWNFSPEEFVEAFYDKENFLRLRHSLELNSWEGQPVLIVDFDDIICNFRDDFSQWIVENKEVNVDPNSCEYYHVQRVVESGQSPESVFEEFMDERNLKKISANRPMVKLINRLYDEGFWIHILTARPDANLICKHDTYAWLTKSGLKFHKISFSPEKFIWLSKTEYFNKGKIVCAIDDSPKHSSEFAKHGIQVASPIKTYNKELKYVDNVLMYKSISVLYDHIHQLTENLNASESRP